MNKITELIMRNVGEEPTEDEKKEIDGIAKELAVNPLDRLMGRK